MLEVKPGNEVSAAGENILLEAFKLTLILAISCCEGPVGFGGGGLDTGAAGGMNLEDITGAHSCFSQ